VIDVEWVQKEFGFPNKALCMAFLVGHNVAIISEKGAKYIDTKNCTSIT
jgi:hypothetical protein